MPRSSSPHAYPTIYFQLIEHFSRSSLPFHVQCRDKSEAFNRRNEWNSFIQALEKHSTETPRYGDLAKIARSRSCAVSGPQETLLVWKPRDLDPFVNSLENALIQAESLLAEENLQLPSEQEFIQLTKEETQTSPNSNLNFESVLDDFIATEEEDEVAADLFDDLLNEAESAKQQTIKDHAEAKDLLYKHVGPIKIDSTFSSEADSDGTENLI